MKTIVVSAVNLVEAGTLAILSDCLHYLSELAASGQYRVVALVYKKELADYPHIEYMETQWPKKRWLNRLWYEYVSMKQISKELGPVYLWFSLHDTSPSVLAERRAVYCHNSYSFYKWKLHDLFFAPKIALFAIFTKTIYQTNIHKNRYLVVQQEWFRQAMANMFKLKTAKIIVAPPRGKGGHTLRQDDRFAETSFLFAGSPNSHKNFELICQAAALLESKYNVHNFNVYITVAGTENKYARWLYRKWGGQVKSLQFVGFLTTETLYRYYAKCHCLLFPSKVETWGLPISEFAAYHKPMLLADLPYAHETAGGSQQVAFFDPNDAEQLAAYMKEIINGDYSSLHPVPKVNLAEPLANNWAAVFQILLHDTKTTDNGYENTASR